MGKSKGAPVPDPVKTVEAQARANRVDEYTPFGSQTFNPMADGRASKTTEFSPAVQPLFEKFVQTADPGYRDFELQGQVFGNAQQLIDQDFLQREDRLRQRLANQGIPTDSEAYAQALQREIFDPRDKAINQAAFGAISAADQRKQTDFNMLAALLGKNQTTPISPLDVMGAQRLAQSQANANAQLEAQQDQQTAAAAASIISAIIMA